MFTFSALLSFLGGSAFRMIWGEISHFITARQEHNYELDRMRLEGELAGAQHARNQEAIRLQAELGVKTIQVQAEADLSRLDAAGFYGAVQEAMKPTGITLVDVWNGCIRPLIATIAVYLWVAALNSQGWHMTEWDRELVAGVFGFFFASRELARRGK